jgi:hypothetical protein
LDDEERKFSTLLSENSKLPEISLFSYTEVYLSKLQVPDTPLN